MSKLVLRLARLFRPFALMVILISVAAPLAGCSGNPTMAPGAYNVEVSKQGFRSFAAPNVQLNANSVVRVDDLIARVAAGGGVHPREAARSRAAVRSR